MDENGATDGNSRLYGSPASPFDHAFQRLQDVGQSGEGGTARRQRRAQDDATADVRSRFANLSPREQQVMTLVTAGKMNKQVAFDLGLSEITVKTYRGAVMEKMAARSFADLVRMADALRQPAA